MRPAIGFLRWRSVLAWAALAAVLAGCGLSQAPQVIVLTGGGSVASAAGGSAAGGGAIDLVAGEEAYLGTCAACHGDNGKGMPGLGKDLVTPSDWFKEQDDAALLAFLKQGRPSSDPLNTTKVDMPPRGGNPAFSEDDLKSIIAYLRSIQEQ